MIFKFGLGMNSPINRKYRGASARRLIGLLLLRAWDKNKHLTTPIKTLTLTPKGDMFVVPTWGHLKLHTVRRFDTGTADMSRELRD